MLGKLVCALVHVVVCIQVLGVDLEQRHRILGGRVLVLGRGCSRLDVETFGGLLGEHLPNLIIRPFVL